MTFPGQLAQPFQLPLLGGDKITLHQAASNRYQLVIYYRGLHCPVCIKYLTALNGMVDEFNAAGIDVVAASCDPQAKTDAIKTQNKLDKITFAYDLPLEKAYEVRDVGHNSLR